MQIRRILNLRMLLMAILAFNVLFVTAGLFSQSERVEANRSNAKHQDQNGPAVATIDHEKQPVNDREEQPVNDDEEQPVNHDVERPVNSDEQQPVKESSNPTDEATPQPIVIDLDDPNDPFVEAITTPNGLIDQANDDDSTHSVDVDPSPTIANSPSADQGVVGIEEIDGTPVTSTLTNNASDTGHDVEEIVTPISTNHPAKEATRRIARRIHLNTLQFPSQVASTISKSIQSLTQHADQGDSANPSRQRSGLVLMNPLQSGGDVHYLVDYTIHTLRPGESHDLEDSRTYVVRFHRGDEFDNVEYRLSEGEYQFLVTEHGWDLHRQSENRQGS